MNTQNIKLTGGITITLFLLYFVLTKYFGLIHIENKSLLGWLLFTSLWLIVFILVLYAKFIEKNKFLIWSETKRELMFYVKTIIGLFAIVVLLGILKTKLGINEGSTEIATNEKFWKDNFLLFIYMGLTAGFAEEFLFRGYILPRIELITYNYPYSSYQL